MSAHLNDPTVGGMGGRQYGASRGIETLESKNYASTGRFRTSKNAVFHLLSRGFEVPGSFWRRSIAVTSCVRLGLVPRNELPGTESSGSSGKAGNNYSDGLLVPEARHIPAIKDFDDSALVFNRGIGSLIAKATHRRLPFGDR